MLNCNGKCYLAEKLKEAGMKKQQAAQANNETIDWEIINLEYFQTFETAINLQAFTKQYFQPISAYPPSLAKDIATPPPEFT